MPDLSGIFSTMIFSFGICSVPAAPLRAEPSHRSEMVSQLLFGEKVEIMKESGAWLFVVCDYDHYEGWVNAGQIEKLPLKAYNKSPQFLSKQIGDRLVSEKGTTLLSPGSSLFGLQGSKFNWQKSGSVKYKGKKLDPSVTQRDAKLIAEYAELFYGAPYLWGGRTAFGIDCSGLTQVVFKMLGYALPRDASQQVQKGHTIGFLQEAQCGDLAFFDNEEGRITHVGLLLDNQTIIHATETSGGVVVDSIDNGGIVSRKLKKRTHNLRIIKRYL